MSVISILSLALLLHLKKMPYYLFRPCFCVHCVLFRCLLYSKNTSRNRRWSTSPGNREPCLHPAASKRQMAGEDAAADAVRSCLLGSHLVLTWQKMQYHSQAGKQITLTSVAGRGVYLSRIQAEFEEIN